MPNFEVILVEPKIEGNIGAVARAMKNFGMEKLVLVNPCRIGEEAVKRAKWGKEVLDSATIVDSLDEALSSVDFVIGSSSVDTESEKKFARISVSPGESIKKIEDLDGLVALLFGREDYGLLKEEIAKCDLLVKIPANEEYPVLNISHAVAIILYEIYRLKAIRKGTRKASGREKELLYSHFRQLLDEIDYPEHKKERTSIMFRRIMGRAVPSKWEYHALMGVFSRTLNNLK
ncbi:MAG: RNA methyltransferase [Thermoplasmata archaeon]